jgi:ABC-type nickel/cobalt efflux system permease component RcnA
MIPSTAALVLLLGAVAAGQPAYGLALAIAFGLGMALVLTGIGLAIVFGRDRIGRLSTDAPGLARAGRVLPWAAASVVVVSGAVLTGQAVLPPLL